MTTRRLTADARARLARPIPFDLLPWRLGPKHRPVVASLLWVAGWTRAKPKRKGGCSMLHLRQAALGEGVVAQQLQAIVRQALAALPDSPEQQLMSLNQQVLGRCAPLFPNRSSGCARPRDNPRVKSCIAAMWQRHRDLKSWGRASTHATV